MTAKTKSRIAWGVTILLVLALMFGSYQCGKRAFTKKASLIDTSVSNDTLRITDTLPVPVYIKKDSLVYVAAKPIIEYVDGEPSPVYIDTSHYPTAIVDDYHTRKKYKVDTAGVKVEEEVYKNSLVKRDLTIIRSDTTISKTEIYEAPKNFVLSFTVSAMGNQKQPLFGQGVGLNAKFPNEETIELNLFHIKDQSIMGMVTKGWPLRFGKKKKLLPTVSTSDTTVKAATINIKK